MISDKLAGIASPRTYRTDMFMNAATEQHESRNGEVIVTVAPDRMSAGIRVVPATGGGKMPAYQDALDKLAAQKVKFGLNEALLKDIFNLRLFEEEHTVAQGECPINGIDGYIKLHIDLNRKIKPREDEKGNVDYRNLNLIVIAEKGQLLAEAIPPTPGTPGRTVTGEGIPPKGGKPVVLPKGVNTDIAGDNPNYLIASIAGSVVKRENGPIDVHPEYVVNGDVDFSCGNIDYIGSLIVKGDVKSGFRIKAGGDIEISGVVEDAEVEAGGNVILAMGIVGTGSGKVIAGGDVYMKYSENQTVITRGSLYVGEAILHSKIRAEKKVIVTGRKGAVIGGEVLALEGLEAKSIGNYQYTRTDILVGIKQEALERMKLLEAEIDKAKENEEKVKAAIFNLIKSSKKMTQERQKLLQKLQQAKTTIPRQLEELDQQKAALEQDLMKYSGARVRVIGTIYPNVRLQIANQRTRINEELQLVEFHLDGFDIVASQYKR